MSGKTYRPALTRAQLADLIATVEQRINNCEEYLSRKRLTPRLVEDTEALLKTNRALLAALRAARRATP